MVEQLIEWDKSVFLFLNGLGSEKWDGLWLVITNKFASIPLYVFLLYLSIKVYGLKKTVYILLSVALMITITDQLANIFKYGFERLRPCHNPSLQEHMRIVICGGKFGYFSAHAASSFALMTFFSLLLSKKYPLISLLLLIWAVSVSYSRIYLGVHFPLDVITGMSLGMLIGWGVNVLFSLLILRRP